MSVAQPVLIAVSITGVVSMCGKVVYIFSNKSVDAMGTLYAVSAAAAILYMIDLNAGVA